MNALIDIFGLCPSAHVTRSLLCPFSFLERILCLVDWSIPQISRLLILWAWFKGKELKMEAVSVSGWLVVYTKKFNPDDSLTSSTRPSHPVPFLSTKFRNSKLFIGCWAWLRVGGGKNGNKKEAAAVSGCWLDVCRGQAALVRGLRLIVGTSSTQCSPPSYHTLPCSIL